MEDVAFVLGLEKCVSFQCRGGGRPLQTEGCVKRPKGGEPEGCFEAAKVPKETGVSCSQGRNK